MEGCVAPSEIPGISVGESSAFGAVAEDLIYADLCTRYARGGHQLFRDANNPAAYLYFLAINNPHFTKELQLDYYTRLRSEKLGRVPDFLIHTAAEKSLYEVKPDSVSGRGAGVKKVGILSAVYQFYHLPYKPGTAFRPRDHIIASAGAPLQAWLRVRLIGPGLIVYKICLESERTIELATLVLLLRYIARQVIDQRGTGRFRSIDLSPAFQQSQQLHELGRTLGIAITGTAVAAVGWRYFWKAVVARFAVRGAAAATLAAADGPLPVGDLLAAGLAIVTVVDILRLHDQLWQDARDIARRGG